MSLPLPENLISRINRVYIANREFTDDSGRVIKYQRLVIVGSINGQDLEVEFKPEKKDLTLLSLFSPADTKLFEE